MLAGASFALLGKSTLAARLPFALCGIVTAVVLADLVRRRFHDIAMAVAAVVLLLGNVLWILHTRQCRYYAPSCLMLLLTLVAYLRWRERGRWGAPLFVLSAAGFFQFDFGTFWPVMGALLADALWIGRGRRLEFVGVVTALAALIGPWIWYYQIFARLKPRLLGFWANEYLHLFAFNQYQMPLLLMPVLAFLIWRATRDLRTRPGTLPTVCLAAAIVVAIIVWVPLVTPYAFYRYLVIATPLSCLLMAYVCVGLVDLAYDGRAAEDLRIAAVLPLAAILVGTQFLSIPTSVTLQGIREGDWRIPGIWRSEWYALYADLLDVGPDPNRELVETLKPLLQPGDEILINYEDIPLMFYTNVLIRGGTPAFRVEDDRAGPPRFVAIRPKIPPAGEAIQRVLAHGTWRAVPVDIESINYGNIPDPLHHRVKWLQQENPKMLLLERVSPENRGVPID